MQGLGRWVNVEFPTFFVVVPPKMQVYEAKVIGGHLYGCHPVMLLFTMFYMFCLTQLKSSIIF